MLTWILAVSAVLCLAYYIVIVTYAGFGTSMAVVWLFLAALLGTACAGVRYCQKYPQKEGLWVPVSLVTLCASGVLVVLALQILMFSRIPSTAEPDLDYLIVLGAQVKPEGVSRTLKRRLDKASEYAAQNPDTVLVLSGARGEDEPVSEAKAMEAYLLERGVLKNQMILEERSCSTVENIAYSKVLMEQDRTMKLRAGKQREPAAGPGSERPARVGIVTSNFHLYRAKLIARKQGLADVRGIAAESDRVLFVHYCMRDGLAILKDRLMGNL